MRNKYNCLFLIICSTIILSIRLLTYNEPLEIDITTYAVIANEMQHGKTLYRDLWDHKAPFNYIIFYFSNVLFGYSHASIFVLNFLFSVLGLLGLYSTAKKLCSEKNAKIACIFWSLLSGSIFSFSNQPNCELFINCFVLLGFSQLLNLEKKNCNASAIWISGFFFALGTLIKHIVLPLIFIFSLYVFIRKHNSNSGIKSVIKFILPTIICWGLALLYFYLTNNIENFIECVFTYNSEYVGSIFQNVTSIHSFFFLAPMGFYNIFAPIIFLSLASIFKRDMNLALVASYFIGCVMMIMLPGRFYPHYYTLIIPSIIILAVMGIDNLELSFLKNKLIIQLVLILCLTPYVYIEFPILLKKDDVISNIKYNNFLNFGGTRDYAKFLKLELPPNYKLYMWGNDTGVYYYTQTSPVTSIFYEFPLSQGKYHEQRLARTMNELKNRKPHGIVEREFSEKPDILIEILNKSYNLKKSLSKNGFTFYIRKDLNRRSPDF